MTSPEPRERTIELPVIRWWPRTLWVRVGISVGGGMDSAWKPHTLYAGMVVRIAWPLVAGRGPYLLWMRKEAPGAFRQGWAARRWCCYMGRFPVPHWLYDHTPRWMHSAADWLGGVEPSPWGELRSRIMRRDRRD